jgi:biopolymer transport protein ExbB
MPRDIRDFPLLVRLDADLIDFSQAAPGGADLRFTKAGGRTPLAYEIEHWDSANRQAEVWVRMDTVFGDAGNQYIQMHWGNPAAKDSSSGSAVFDTALGYGGVWHLSEGSNDAGFPGYLDATANGNTGKGAGISDTTVGPGAVGRGQRLDGNGAYIKVTDHPSLDFGTGDFCISLWARPDAFTHSRQLVSKRETEGGDYEFQLQTDRRVENYTGEAGASEMLPSRRQLGLGEWHLLAMRRSGGTVGFYVDGVLDTADAPAKTFNLDNASDFFIGHDAQNLPEDWQGGIDEVRAARVAPSADWLRLSYLNQMAGSKLVSPFRP